MARICRVAVEGRTCGVLRHNVVLLTPSTDTDVFAAGKGLKVTG